MNFKASVPHAHAINFEINLDFLETSLKLFNAKWELFFIRSEKERGEERRGEGRENLKKTTQKCQQNPSQTCDALQGALVTVAAALPSSVSLNLRN